MPYTNELHVAAAYLALGHQLTQVDPVSFVRLPDGSDLINFNFQDVGQDSRFTRQQILEAVNIQPDAASRFDDFLAQRYPELVCDWHNALAAAAARGAKHAHELIELVDTCPVLVATQRDGETLFINADATPEQIKQLAKL